MKKNFIVKQVAIIMVATGILVSCSKNDLVIEEQSTAASGKVDSKPASTITQTGSVIGKINPAGKRKLWIVDAGGRTLGPFAPEFLTGNFRVNELPAGNYKLVIENPSVIATNDIQVATVTVPVEVKAGLVTDLGTISL